MFSSLRAATPGLILAAVIVAIISLPAQASDPAAGTWELNLAKSKFINVPTPKSQTRTYEVSGEQEKMIGKGIDAKGNETLFEFTANRDGKDYPYKGSPIYDSISFKTVDARTVSYTTKKAGKLATYGTRVVSADGKEMTFSGKGTDAQGQPFEANMIFDKR
jgi:hypothetical protein